MVGNKEKKEKKKDTRDADARLKLKEKIRLKQEYLRFYIDQQWAGAYLESKLDILNRIGAISYDTYIATGKMVELVDGRPKTEKEIFWDFMKFKKSYKNCTMELENIKRELLKYGVKEKDLKELREDYGLI